MQPLKPNKIYTYTPYSRERVYVDKKTNILFVCNYTDYFAWYCATPRGLRPCAEVEFLRMTKKDDTGMGMYNGLESEEVKKQVTKKLWQYEDLTHSQKVENVTTQQ